MLASEPKTPTTATITEVICITSPEKAFPQGAYTHASFPRLAGGQATVFPRHSTER